MHDVIVIGAGPAGLSAGFWCSELGLDTLVLEQRSAPGGQLASIYHPIDSYLGVQVESGAEMRDRFIKQTGQSEFDLWTDAEIAEVDLSAKTITLRSGEELRSICLILATGVRRRRLGIPGEAEFAGRGVAESGHKDREFLAGKDVCVVGGGDAAVENALMLAEICPTVTLLHRGPKLSARAEFTGQLSGNHCITVFRDTVLRQIIGTEAVEGIEIVRSGALKPTQIAVRGVLIRVGVKPNTEPFAGQVGLDDRGYVIVDRDRATGIENVFAVGDVSNPLAPTIAGAVGDGAGVAKVIAARLRS